MLFRVHYWHNGAKHSVVVDKDKPMAAANYVRNLYKGAQILKTKSIKA